MCDGLAVRVNGLFYKYPDGTEALRGVSFEVRRGDKLAIIGPNGAGKSTLVSHLNGILTGNGVIEINGLPLNKTNLGRIRAMVGVVFQDPDDQLFCPTVFDDVAFAPLNMGLPAHEVRDRVNRALEQVQLAGYESRNPFHLSFGEKKRVALATILSQSPEIVVLDEPTGNLDPASRLKLINLLKGFDQTLILATHDLDMAYALCDECLLLNDGRVVTRGKSREILADEPLLKANDLEVPLSLQLSRLKGKV